MFSVTLYVYFTLCTQGLSWSWVIPTCQQPSSKPVTSSLLPTLPLMDISSACYLLARLLGVKPLFCHLSWAAVPSLFHFLFLGGTHTWTFGGPPGCGSLDFHPLSTSFLPSLPFLSTKPHGVHHFSRALSISSTPSVPTVFLARLPGKPASLQQAVCLASNPHLGSREVQEKVPQLLSLLPPAVQAFHSPWALNSLRSYFFISQVIYSLYVQSLLQASLWALYVFVSSAVCSSHTPCAVSVWLLSSLPGEWTPHPFIWPRRYPCDLVPT